MTLPTIACATRPRRIHTLITAAGGAPAAREEVPA